MSAPKGNQYAVGNKGTSKKWTTPKDLNNEIGGKLIWDFLKVKGFQPRM